MRRRCCRPPRLAMPAGGQPSAAGEAEPAEPSLPWVPAAGKARGHDVRNGQAMPLPLLAPLTAEPGAAEGATPSRSPRRILAILLPRLPVERLRRPGQAAIWAWRGSRRVVVSVSAMA